MAAAADGIERVQERRGSDSPAAAMLCMYQPSATRIHAAPIISKCLLYLYIFSMIWTGFSIVKNSSLQKFWILPRLLHSI